MKTNLLAPILISCFLLNSCTQPKPTVPSTNMVPNKAIAANIQLFDPANPDLPKAKQYPKSVNEFLISDAMKLSKQDAYRSLYGLKTALKNSYVGYELKKDLIGKNGDEIMSDCYKLAFEKESYTTFEFYDIVLQCISLFQDGHLWVQRKSNSTFVTTVIAQLKIVEGRAFVVNTRPKLMVKLEELSKVASGTFTSKIQPGIEILTVDEKPVMEEIKDNTKFITGSSEAARINNSADKFFTRIHNYPKSSQLKVTAKLLDGSIEELVLPWLQADDGSAEARVLLDTYGIYRTSLLSEEPKKLIVRNYPGYVSGDRIIKDLKNLTTYSTAEIGEFFTTGQMRIAEKDACYIQLTSFDIESDKDDTYWVTTQVDGKEEKVDLMASLAVFLKECDEKQMPLVFDLNENGGGSSWFADELFSLFVPPDQSLKGRAFNASSKLVETGNMSYISNLLNDIDKPSGGIAAAANLMIFKKAVKEKKSYTDWLVVLPNSFRTGLFNQKILALISPNCVSACEGFSSRLKLSGRAQLIGLPTHGTGFGFSTSGKMEKGKTTYRDALNLYEVNIPNHAFVAGLVEEEKDFESRGGAIFGEIEFKKLKVMENNPVTPHVRYEPSLKDYLDGYSDYAKKIGELL